MSCVLRFSSPRLDARVQQISVKPYRVERNTAHFDVSKRDFDDLSGQVSDAVNFLQTHAAELKQMLSDPGAEGTLDFAVESREGTFHFDTFPATLVREAGSLGIALTVSHYPVTESGSGAA